VRSVAPASAHVTVPLPALLRTEVRLHLRHGVVSAVAVLTGLWVALLLVLPAEVRPHAVPWVLFLDLATLGFFFAPALTVVERGNGVTTALALTRLSPTRALVVRVGLLGAWSVAAATAVVVAAQPAGAVIVVVAALVTTLLFALLAVVMVGRHRTLTGFLPRVPAVGVPLLAPALVHGAGLWDGAVLWLSPATGAFELLAGRWSTPALAWLIVCVAALGAAAARIGFQVLPASHDAPSANTARNARTRSGAQPARPGGLLAAARAFARVDRRNLLSDSMLLLLVAGVPLLALLVRVAGGPGLAWVQARYGVDLAPHLPAMWALVVVLHTPTMFGTLCGLLFVEDRDAGLLPAILTTRASLRSLVAYRLTLTAVGTTVAVFVALAIAGANHVAGAGGVLATALVAGAVSTVPAMLMAALARDRVAGMALMKVLGLPLYLPLAWWFIDHPAGWLFGIVPTGWAVQAFWADSATTSFGFAAAGTALSLTLVAMLMPRLHRSLTG
jgi:hypothetical protein